MLRDCTDDGVLTALLLGPLISCACYRVTSQLASSLSPSTSPLPTHWLIEPPIVQPKPDALSPIESLLLSRRALVQLSSLTSSLLLVHLICSRLYEARQRAWKHAPEGERASVPRSEWQRSKLYIVFGFATAIATVGAKYLFVRQNMGIWNGREQLQLFKEFTDFNGPFDISRSHIPRCWFRSCILSVHVVHGHTPGTP